MHTRRYLCPFAIISSTLQEEPPFYTVDNTATGGIITVTEAIPEFPPFVMLAALITMTLAVSLASKRKQKTL